MRRRRARLEQREAAQQRRRHKKWLTYNRANATIAAHALAKHVRMSPQKARLVIDLIRGQQARKMRCRLCGSRRSARPSTIEKLLRSAIANAERKAEDAGAPLDVDELFVNEVLRERRRALEAFASGADGPRIPLPETHGASVVGVAEHHRAAAERVAANRRKLKHKRACVAQHVGCARR